MTFGERVLALRTEKGMTQDELALAVGYKSRSTIAKIESGERDPHQSMIATIAKALDTTPAYLRIPPTAPDHKSRYTADF